MGIFSRSTPEFEAIKADLQDQTRRVREVLAAVEGIELEIKARLREIEERLDAQAKAGRLMAEEMEERIDRGNKVWRRIRASEYYEKQRQDSEEDEDPGFDLPSGDGEGGGPEGVQYLPPRMGWPGRPPTKAQEMGKALARRIAGLE